MNKRKTVLESLLTPVVRISVPPDAESKPGEAPPAPSAAPERRPGATAGSLKMMGLALDSLNASAEEAEALREQLAAGDRVVELDPGLIDRSPVEDRIQDPLDPDFETLMESLRTSGQQVPILVRPHPTEEGRYQAAYGHRRLRAAQALGRTVRAVVRTLSDDELVVAQGRENLERRDLSFIERAQFALSLERLGYGRQTILEAVEPNKGNLSVMLSIVRDLPDGLVAAIGPAPKVGRPRWMELGGTILAVGGPAAAMDLLKDLLASQRFTSASSDDRFGMVLKTLQGPDERPTPRVIQSREGQSIARLDVSGRQSRIVLDDRLFADFVAARLPDLHAEFAKSGASRRKGGAEKKR